MNPMAVIIGGRSILSPDKPAKPMTNARIIKATEAIVKVGVSFIILCGNGLGL